MLQINVLDLNEAYFMSSSYIFYDESFLRKWTKLGLSFV